MECRPHGSLSGHNSVFRGDDALTMILVCLVLFKHCGLSLPVIGASGFSQLTTMEVSPTSSTSWSEGASGAGGGRNVLEKGLNERISERRDIEE